MQCFDQVVAFYLENYAGKSERQKSSDRTQPDPTSQTALQFQMEPMEVDQVGAGTTTTTTTTTSTASPASRLFEEELAAVETTLTW